MSDRSAGSISAILKADDSQLIAALEASGVKIDELKAKNPKITINTNSTEVLAQLTAISVAAKRVGDSSQSVDALTKKLADLKASGVATEDEMKKIDSVSAQLEKALRSQGAAAVQLSNSYAKIGGSSSDLEKVANSTESAGSSMGLLLPALIGVAAVLAGPILAVGAGALGTLALGARGLESQVVSGLTPAFSGLEKTAVNALGPGILAAVGQVAQALPQLTPLITVFGQEIGTVADQFATWLNNGGLAGFVKYAEQELPIVEGTVTSLAGVVVKFFGDVTPLANIFLNTLTTIADTFGKIGDFTSKTALPAAGGQGTPAAQLESPGANGGSLLDHAGHCSITSTQRLSLASPRRPRKRPTRSTTSTFSRRRAPARMLLTSRLHRRPRKRRRCYLSA